MPITYQAPQPYNPGISAAYGATEEFNKLAPVLEAHNAAQERNYAQMYMDAGHQRDQMVGLAAHRDAQQQGQAAQLQAHSQDQALQGQMQSEAIRARSSDIQLHAMLQGQALSQQENMQLQRMQSAIGDVMSNDSYGAEEKRDLVMQLKTGIDPLRQRLERTKNEQEQRMGEQEIKMATEKAKAQSLHNNIIDDMRSGNMKKWQQDLYDEEGNHIGTTVPDGKGGIHVLPPAKKEKEAKTAGPAALKAADVAKIHHDVTEATNRRAAMMDKSDPQNPKPLFPGLQDPEARAKEIKSEFEARISEVNKHFTPPQPEGSGRSPWLKNLFRGANIGGSAPSVEPQPQGPSSLKNPFKDQGATAELQPFKLDKPETMNPQQKAIAQTFVAQAQLIDQSSPHDLNHDEARVAQSHLNNALAVIQDFGSYNAMPDFKKSEFDLHLRGLDHYLDRMGSRAKNRRSGNAAAKSQNAPYTSAGAESPF